MISPSNVLIALYDGKPVPKVIDFGVAKAVSQKLTDRTMFTEVGQVIGTLEYMAPEQAELNNLDIDTRADVYSLGVLLYELLTGSPPFSRKDLQAAAFVEMLRIIKEVEPSKPSTKLSASAELPSIAAKRKLEPKRLTRLMHGDLDWIAMKCLEKERARRYETANGLALDIQRYLADEPVAAGPPSARYRVRKFARKHYRLLATAAAFVTILAVAAVVSSWLAVRAVRAEGVAREAEGQARYEAEHAKAISEFLRNDLLAKAAGDHEVQPDLAPLAEMKLRTVLDRAAARIGGKFEGQPLVEAAIRMTIGSTYAGLRLESAARPHFDRALEIRRRLLGDEHPDTLDSLHDLGANHLNSSGSAQAEVLFTKVFDARRRVLGEEHPGTLATLHCLGLSVANRSLAESEKLLVQCAETRRRVLGEEHMETRNTLAFLANVYANQGKYDLAEPIYVRNLEVSRRMLGEDHVVTLFDMDRLGRFRSFLGNYALAEPLLVKAYEGLRVRNGEDHTWTMNTVDSLAELYRRQQKYAQAETTLLKALDAYRRARGSDHLPTLSKLAALYEAQQDYASAEPLYGRLMEGVRRVSDAGSAFFVSVLSQRGQNLLRQGRYADAEPLFRECLAIRENKLPDDWSRFNTQSLLGESLCGQKCHADAEPLLVAGYEGMKAREARIPVASKPRLAEAAERLVQLYEAWGMPEKAKEWRAKLPPPKP